MKVSKLKSSVFFAPFFIIFVILWLIPLIFGVIISLFEWNMATGSRTFVGLKNYIAIFTPGTMYNKLFFDGLNATLTFVVISVPALVIISLALALLVDNLPEKLKPIVRTIFFISYSISVTAVAAIFLWIFNGNGGYINNVLINLNIIQSPINWVGEQPYAWIVILIATVWWTIGYNMILFINALNEVDDQLYEAASLDGARYIDKFKAIILPSIKGVLMFVILTTIVASFNIFGQTQLITAGGPFFSTSTAIMNIQRTVLQLNQLGAGSAMALLLGAIMSLIFMIQQIVNKRLDKGDA